MISTAGTIAPASAGAASAAAMAASANAGMGVTSFLDDEVNGITTAGSTITRVGTKFIVRPKQTETNKTALLTIVANETGGFKTVTISVTANYPIAQVGAVR